MSKIEQTIEDMQAYFRECKSPTFSGAGKIICEKNVIDEFIEELILSTPEEIKKYQKIISQKDAILGDAKSQSAAMVAEAQRQTQKMIDEHEITQAAQEEAQRIMEEAGMQSRQIHDEAMAYVSNLLQDLEGQLTEMLFYVRKNKSQF